MPLVHFRYKSIMNRMMKKPTYNFDSALWVAEDTLQLIELAVDTYTLDERSIEEIQDLLNRFNLKAKALRTARALENKLRRIVRDAAVTQARSVISKLAAYAKDKRVTEEEAVEHVKDLIDGNAYETIVALRKLAHDMMKLWKSTDKVDAAKLDGNEPPEDDLKLRVDNLESKLDQILAALKK